MREAERALVRSCIEQDKDMPFDDIVATTGLVPEKVSQYLADVVAESDSWNKFFKNDDQDDTIESPWDVAIDEDLLDKYKKELGDKTEKIKPLLVMKLYMELEHDKKIAQGKLNKLGHSPHSGSRWLELKLKARNEQIKLLGLDAAQKIDIGIGLSRTKAEKDEIFAAAQMRGLLPAGSI